MKLTEFQSDDWEGSFVNEREDFLELVYYGRAERGERREADVLWDIDRILDDNYLDKRDAVRSEEEWRAEIRGRILPWRPWQNMDLDPYSAALRVRRAQEWMKERTARRRFGDDVGRWGCDVGIPNQGGIPDSMRGGGRGGGGGGRGRGGRRADEEQDEEDVDERPKCG